jgi:release factor glutamine methyltransferase
VSDLSLESYLRSFYEKEKKNLLSHYPGLTLHRLKQDLKLHAFLKGVDSEELFELSYLPHKNNPITLFFEALRVGVPLEYITGYAYFYRSLFKVTSDVLIPRSETEILVELTSSEIKRQYKNKDCRILDVGTGSGIIALSLMMDDYARLHVTASDISSLALTIAKENFFNLRYAISPVHKITFKLSDRLHDIDGLFDIIVSNPPYIKSKADLGSVHHQVRTYEPHLALFVEDMHYDLWFEDLFKGIYQKLTDQGMSLVEGHEDHLQGLSQLALKCGFKKADVIKDYTQRDRFLRLTK